MHIDLPDSECSNCHSLDSEKFIQKYKSGRRCLDCGHEQVDRPPRRTIGAWTSSNDTVLF